MKNYRNSIYFIISITVIIDLVIAQTTSSITPASLEYSGAFGLGWGVLAIIFTFILGVLCCIFGSATVFPGLFMTIGFCLPISMFIFMACVPLDQPGNLNLKDNDSVNSLIVVKWFYLVFIIIGLLVLSIPFMTIWSYMLIPQRVDSRAQREYYEKYEKLLVEERLKIDRESDLRSLKAAEDAKNKNGNEAEILLPVERSDQNNLNMQANAGVGAGVNFNNANASRNINNMNVQNLANNQFGQTNLNLDYHNDNSNNMNDRNNLNSNAFAPDRKKKTLNNLRRKKEVNIDEISDDKIE